MSAMMENLAELRQYRALLFSLIARELQVRYRGSVLGFLWTFLNPILQMVVYSLVFGVYQRIAMPNYSYFLFVGLLPWNWLATSVIGGTSAISDRRDLISKVKFPPQILPATIIGSAFCNYLFALPLMIGFGVLSGVHFGVALIAFPVVAFAQLLLTSGIVYITATINVTFRDLQHMLGNLIMFAFFLTPVLYPTTTIPEKYRPLVLMVNPFAALMDSYQDIFFRSAWPDFAGLGRVALLGLLLFWLGSIFMSARREAFAELA
jgi:lipopolysaccharide transport system permease protein